MAKDADAETNVVAEANVDVHNAQHLRQIVQSPQKGDFL